MSFTEKCFDARTADEIVRHAKRAKATRFGARSMANEVLCNEMDKVMILSIEADFVEADGSNMAHDSFHSKKEREEPLLLALVFSAEKERLVGGS